MLPISSSSCPATVSGWVSASNTLRPTDLGMSGGTTGSLARSVDPGREEGKPSADASSDLGKLGASAERPIPRLHLGEFPASAAR